MIVDLSNVNNFISVQLCSLSYASIEQIAGQVKATGHEALMGKHDHCSAYRRVPVHPQDCCLLVTEWQGVVYYDKALPFGLCSTPSFLLQ